MRGSGSALGQGQGLGLEMGRASLGPIFQTMSRDPSSKLQASKVRALGAAFRGGAGSRVSSDAQSRVVAIGGGSRVMPGALGVLSMEPSRGAGSCCVSGSFMPWVEFRGRARPSPHGAQTQQGARCLPPETSELCPALLWQPGGKALTRINNLRQAHIGSTGSWLGRVRG